MNKATMNDVINIFYENYGKDNGMTKKEADQTFKNVLDAIKDALVNYDKISLYNFGTITVKDVPETTRVYTMGQFKGEEYIVPAHKTVKMKFGKSVQEMVN